MQVVSLSIPCEVYSRLATLALSVAQTENRNYLRSIYVERRNGKLIAVVTNVKTAAIENLGVQPGDDCSVAIVADEKIIAQCNIEKNFGAALNIVVNDMLKYTAIKSTFGASYEQNCYVDLPQKCEFKLWRQWLPDALPVSPYGAMFSNLEMLSTLARTSPTGRVVFPAIIDARVPVVVRDVDDDRWLGVFVPNSLDMETGEITYHAGAKFPEWL